MLATDTAHFKRFLEKLRAEPRIPLRQQQAYVLATVRHESDRRWYTKNPDDIWLPCDEIGKGKGRKYGITFYGRGFVQLTWEANYQTFSKLLGVDLVAHPEKANDYDTAFEILVLGMTLGKFTGKRLSDYIHEGGHDYINSRRIINVLDKAELIADYASRFDGYLHES